MLVTYYYNIRTAPDVHYGKCLQLHVEGWLNTQVAFQCSSWNATKAFPFRYKSRIFPTETEATCTKSCRHLTTSKQTQLNCPSENKELLLLMPLCTLCTCKHNYLCTYLKELVQCHCRCTLIIIRVKGTKKGIYLKSINVCASENATGTKSQVHSTL